MNKFIEVDEALDVVTCGCMKALDIEELEELLILLDNCRYTVISAISAKELGI